MPKVSWNLPAKAALGYSSLQGKISCWQKHFCRTRIKINKNQDESHPDRTQKSRWDQGVHGWGEQGQSKKFGERAVFNPSHARIVPPTWAGS